jgi:signal peptidase
MGVFSTYFTVKQTKFLGDGMENDVDERDSTQKTETTETTVNTETIENTETTEVAETTSEVTQAEYAVKSNKVLSVVKKVLLAILIAIVAFLIVVASIMCWDKFVNKSPAPSVFGYAGLIVTTGSMSGTIEEGDMVVIKQTDDYKIGDIVTYIREGESTPTTHRIVNYDGELYVTKGDANNAEDLVHISADEILGEVVTTIPHVGLFFTWVSSEGGWIYIVAIVGILVLGIVLVKFTLNNK